MENQDSPAFAATSGYLPDKAGLVVTGTPKPLTTEEPDPKEKTRWLRWKMAMTGCSLREAYDAHPDNTKRIDA